MNPIALYLASGESLYSGAALLLLLIFVTPWIKNRWLLRLRMLLMWIALALMAMACPPVAWWLAGLFLGTFITWIWLSGTPAQPVTPARQRAQRGISVALALLTILLPLLELPHRLRPQLAGPRADHLVVIGDSISAGLGDTPWPAMLQKQRGIPVKNLARAGDETSDALLQTPKLTPDDTLLLIEIGGNDLIAGIPSAEFEARLDKLLAASAAPGRTLIMFELPLLPHRIAYGRIQRQLAARYQVQLIPKRYFVEVLRAGTSDGLHLSPDGAQRMADLVGDLLAPLFPEKNPHPRTSQPALTLPQTAH